MKFNIQSKLLLQHLQAVSKVVNSKNTLAILDNFLFNLEGDKLIVTGSDQETTLTSAVQVTEAEGNGKFAANVKRMLDLLKELPDLGLSFTINDENLEIDIRHQNGHSHFIGVNGNEFPSKAPAEEEQSVLTLPIEKVVAGLQHTIFAVGTESLRPMMMGVYWDIKPTEIAFVATDTHKLVRYKQQNLAVDIEKSFILPTKPATILASVLEKKEGDVTISFDSKGATFQTQDYTLSCRFINSRYPNYNSVIPQDNQYEVNVDRMTLLSAIKRVSVFSSPGGLVKLQLAPNSLVMTTQNIDFSTSAEERVQCEYDGVEMTIGFNDASIIDVLNNINSESVTIKLLDPSRAGLFLPGEQKEGEDLLVLLMPMMV